MRIEDTEQQRVIFVVYSLKPQNMIKHFGDTGVRQVRKTVPELTPVYVRDGKDHSLSQALDCFVRLWQERQAIS